MSESTQMDGEYIPSETRSTDPNEVVKFTQQLRYRVVDNLTQGGTHIPADSAELMSVLRDMDNSALTTRKLNIEEKSANDGRKTIQMYRELRSMFGNATPLAGGGDSDSRPDPTQGVSIPEVPMIPGEDFQGEQALNVADYVSVDD